MELCFNEMTVMKNGTLPEDIALCAQAGFSAVELRKGTLLRYLRGGGTPEALRQTLEEQHVRGGDLPRDCRFAAAALGRRGGLRRAAGAGIYGGAGQLRANLRAVHRDP